MDTKPVHDAMLSKIHKRSIQGQMWQQPFSYPFLFFPVETFRYRSLFTATQRKDQMAGYGCKVPDSLS